MWPFFVVPGPRVYTLGLLLMLLWAAWGAYLWLGRLVPARGPRLLGALLCAFNPWTAKIFIFSSMGAACWMGWILWAWDQALTPHLRRWWLPAVMIALSAYSGHPEIALMMAACSAFYAVAVWAVGGSERLPPLRFLGVVAGTVCLSALLAAVQWLPVLARLPEVVAYKFQGAKANLTPGHYLFTDVFNPRSPVFVNPALWCVLLLGLVASVRLRRLWPLLVLAIVSLQLSFWTIGIGPIVRFQTAGGMMPGIYARGALWFSIGALVSAGAAFVAGAERGRWFSVRLVALGALAFAGLSWADYQQGSMIYLFLHKDLILFYAFLVALLLVGAFLRPGLLQMSVLGLAALALVAAPLADTGFRYSYFNETRPSAEASPAIEALHGRGYNCHDRIAGALQKGHGRPCLSPDLATLWRVRDARLLDVLQNRRLWSLQRALGAKPRKLLRTFVAFPDLTLKGWGLLGVKELAVTDTTTKAQIRWERIPGARSRAFITHRVTAASDEETSEREVATRTKGGLDAPVVLEGWTGPETLGAISDRDAIVWKRDGLSAVRLGVTVPEGGLLVLLDTYASGWEARVDGKRAHIYPADLAFRGVVLPPGTHDVSFQYRPWSVPVGGGLAFVGWLLVALEIFRSMRARRGSFHA